MIALSPRRCCIDFASHHFPLPFRFSCRHARFSPPPFRRIEPPAARFHVFVFAIYLAMFFLRRRRRQAPFAIFAASLIFAASQLAFACYSFLATAAAAVTDGCRRRHRCAISPPPPDWRSRDADAAAFAFFTASAQCRRHMPPLPRFSIRHGDISISLFAVFASAAATYFVFAMIQRRCRRRRAPLRHNTPPPPAPLPIRSLPGASAFQPRCRAVAARFSHSVLRHAASPLTPPQLPPFRSPAPAPPPIFSISPPPLAAFH